ncbi:MAG: GDP-mannose 4,6-dehydratase [Anaerolineae bacterium]|nr:GDP-mannose 4,6-dehydratase [Anaerolineae bacterium]
MRILITGVGGFVGGHLATYLLDNDPLIEIHGTTLNLEQKVGDSRIRVHALDLRDEQAVRQLIEDVEPDHIYHLAAQSSPRRSFVIPWETLENNIRAQLNLILACIHSNLTPRLLIVSSAEIYGPVAPDQQPIHEDLPLRPTNPYGVSKVTQDMLALQYYLSHKLPILRVRPFNHIGTGQSEGFVATDFAKQIARIEAGLQAPVMVVGNLGAERDFTDVRDMVRAYGLIMTQGHSGAVYNVASGETHSIRELLDTLLRHSTMPIEVQVDPARMMPIDVPIIRGDSSKLRAATGWQPTIPFEQTLRDVLDDWRVRVREQR